LQELQLLKLLKARKFFQETNFAHFLRKGATELIFSVELLKLCFGWNFQKSKKKGKVLEFFLGKRFFKVFVFFEFPDFSEVFFQVIFLFAISYEFNKTQNFQLFAA
jgi:hypothetical protein